jgi:hypothetical protein
VSVAHSPDRGDTADLPLAQGGGGGRVTAPTPQTGSEPDSLRPAPSALVRGAPRLSLRRGGRGVSQEPLA